MFARRVGHMEEKTEFTPFEKLMLEKFEAVGQFQTAVMEKFAAVEKFQTAVINEFAKIEKFQAVVIQRFDKLEARMDRMEHAMVGVLARLSSLETRMNHLEVSVGILAQVVHSRLGETVPIASEAPDPDKPH